jgi:hypothetical protein
VWVMTGTFYTLIGFGFLVMLWWHELDAIATPWQGGAVVLGIAMSAFVASGLPMAIGDAVRAHKRRQEGDK